MTCEAKLVGESPIRDDQPQPSPAAYRLRRGYMRGSPSLGPQLKCCSEFSKISPRLWQRPKGRDLPKELLHLFEQRRSLVGAERR
jgi:hypothetical protein